MAFERIKDQSESVTRSRGEKIGRLLSPGDFSALTADSPGALRPSDRAAIEAEGFDQDKVQEAVDWLTRHSFTGEQRAAQLRGAFNDLIDRLNAREQDTPDALTAERIEKVTNFRLVATFTGFAREEGYISPELHEERERLSGQFGEDNVLPSFYADDAGVTQLGLFVRNVD